MLFIESPYIDPYVNLALEEFCFNNLSDDVFMLWQNDNTIVVGKYQNTVQEISNSYVEQNKISVVRRLSGGGAVYHDLGNLNFSFIRENRDTDTGFRFEHFTEDIIELLAGLGVKAEFNSRNDLVIDGKKFSGNSQYIKNNKTLHHGTLLFDSNLGILRDALNVAGKKAKSGAIPSVSSQVTNIRPHLTKDMSIDMFREYIKNFFADKYHIKTYSFSKEETEEIIELAKNKYATWEWNYGSSPSSYIKKEGRCKSGKMEVYLKLEGGYLKDIRIHGDFFAFELFENALDEMKGKKFSSSELKGSIDKVACNMRDIDKSWLFDLIMN